MSAATAPPLHRKGADMTQLHKFGSCLCCGDLLARRFDRRHVLRAAGGIGLATALAPFMALAAEGHYDAMVLGCIDPRLQEPVGKYTADRRARNDELAVFAGQAAPGGEIGRAHV